MRNVSDKSCRDNKTRFFQKLRRLGDNIENLERNRLQLTTWSMCISCWLTKSTNTHSKYVTHLFSTATMVAGTRLNITLHAHSKCCYICKYY